MHFDGQTQQWLNTTVLLCIEGLVTTPNHAGLACFSFPHVLPFFCLELFCLALLCLALFCLALMCLQKESPALQLLPLNLGPPWLLPTV